MKIARDLSPAQSEKLRGLTASLGVDAEELARAAVADPITVSENDFESAALRVLQNNRELYHRLPK